MLLGVRSIKVFPKLISASSRMDRTLKTRSYKDAIEALNNLQTNSQVLDAVIKERQQNVHLNLPQTQTFLERSGMTLKNLVR
jgi:hypothetical protein